MVSRIVDADMRKLLCLLAISTGMLSAQNALSLEKHVPGKALWRWSLTSLAAANVLDVHSSWGKAELNPTLAGPNGTFGLHGALLKCSFQGGLMGLEYLITRAHPSPKIFRALSVLNFAASAGTAGVAIHNYTIRRPN
jgi:hypothetical protein